MSASIVAVSPAEDTPSAVIRNRVVCFVNDDLSAAAVRKGLEGSEILEVKRGTIRNAIKMLETDTELLGLVADISEIDDPITELERLSRVCPADVRVAADRREHGYLILPRAYGSWPERIPSETAHNATWSKTWLRTKLLWRHGVRSDGSWRACDLGICRRPGGRRATSIAINLALQLAETTKAKVALLDLHLQGGETAVMLGVRPGPGLRIALENPMRADTLFLERAAIDINERVRLISADEELDAKLDITEEGVRHVLGLLRQRFNYIVVDLPVPLAPAIHPVIALSRHVLVLLEAEVTGLRNAHALRAAVTNIAGKNRVFTLLNRANRAGGLPTATIVKALGGKPDMVIPDLGKGMTQAVNLGIPALKHVPRLRRYLAPIVREIAAVGDEQKGWLRRLLGR